MKIKLFFKRFKILFGMFVIIILFIISYLIYINRGNEVIAYDSNEEIIKEKVEEIEEKKEEVKKIKVDIKGMIAIPGVYELDEGSRVIDQTTPNMIQRISGIFERNPLISREI